jgi:hypothetical protein
MTVFEAMQRLLRLVWATGFVAGLTAAESRPETAKPAEADPDFTGKVLAVNVKSTQGKAGGVLEKVKVRRLGGRTFLVGQVPAWGGAKGPMAGVTRWIATDEVTQILEFKDLKEAMRAYESFAPLTSARPVQRDDGVWEVQGRNFALPVRIDPARRTGVTGVRLFVSRDDGKTWEHYKDTGPDEDRVQFSAPRDGTYWFAVQVVLKEDAKDPPDLKDLVPAMKVYVNSARKPLPVRMPDAEQEREGP